MKLKELGLSAKDIKDKVDKYMIETYERFDFIAETAKDQYMYDENGTPYLDFYAGIAVNSAGNCNEKVVAAVKDQVEDIMHTFNYPYTIPQALLAEKVGANTQEIARAMGMDGRISPKFLHCGPGYGGSCFPKDTRAIVDVGKKYGEEMLVIKAAIEANQKQKKRVIEKIISKMNGVSGKIIGILGLSFKPDTDDMREAPSIDIIRGLVKSGAKIHAYCPEGIKEARWRLADIEKNIIYCADE